jgi:hypothetical protein
LSPITKELVCSYLYFHIRWDVEGRFGDRNLVRPVADGFPEDRHLTVISHELPLDGRPIAREIDEPGRYDLPRSTNQHMARPTKDEPTSTGMWKNALQTRKTVIGELLSQAAEAQPGDYRTAPWPRPRGREIALDIDGHRSSLAWGAG